MKTLTPGAEPQQVNPLAGKRPIATSGNACDGGRVTG